MSPLLFGSCTMTQIVELKVEYDFEPHIGRPQKDEIIPFDPCGL